MTITDIGIMECNILVSGSFNDKENNSDITKKTTNKQEPICYFLDHP